MKTFNDILSQSPQAGQFNSYSQWRKKTIQFPFWVSIPSSGSIQFLHILIALYTILAVCIGLNPLKRVNSILTAGERIGRNDLISLNPLKRVNSILTYRVLLERKWWVAMSQSPQAGQFNSYLPELTELRKTQVKSQSPQAGQFNSY